jgi:hypothetical protein
LQQKGGVDFQRAGDLQQGAHRWDFLCRFDLSSGNRWTEPGFIGHGVQGHFLLGADRFNFFSHWTPLLPLSFWSCRLLVHVHFHA